MTTTMKHFGLWANKGLKPISTGTYVFYAKTGDDTKSVKEETTTTGPKIIVSTTSRNPREKKLTGYFYTINGANATTITNLHIAACALSTRPAPCINNILLPSMILTVTDNANLFSEFKVGTKWMVDNFTIVRTPDKGLHAYEADITLLQYFGNLEE